MDERQTSGTRTILVAIFLLLVVLTVENGILITELKAVRSEQVKNAYFALPDDRVAKLSDQQKARLSKQLGSMVKVHVENEPLSVTVDD